MPSFLHKSQFISNLVLDPQDFDMENVVMVFRSINDKHPITFRVCSKGCRKMPLGSFAVLKPWPNDPTLTQHQANNCWAHVGLSMLGHLAAMLGDPTIVALMLG